VKATHDTRTPADRFTGALTSLQWRRNEVQAAQACEARAAEIFRQAAKDYAAELDRDGLPHRAAQVRAQAEAVLLGIAWEGVE
jgi:hypothetical protein